MGYTLPFVTPVPLNGQGPISRVRRALEGTISEHMEGFGAALEGRVPKNPADRVRAWQYLLTGWGMATQAREVAMALYQRQPGVAIAGMAGKALEAELANVNLQAAIADFITQAVHMSLDIFPRLISTRLVSVQPFTQPNGYIFHLRRVARDATIGGGERNLSDLSTFNALYADLEDEGDQVKAVGVTLDKTLVECKYKALTVPFSHQMDVALRTQYGLSISLLGDATAAHELAWETDREVIDALVAFAETNPLGEVFFDPTRAGTYDTLTPSEQQAYDRSFVEKTMTAVALDMVGSVYRKPSWWLAGLNVAKLLARTPGAYASMAGDKNMYDQMSQSGGIIQSGVMTDGAMVYTDPQLDPDTMIGGYYDNNNPFYAGYVFCPFGAASLITEAWRNPDNLFSQKSYAIAFAQAGIRPEQYRVIKLGTS